MEESEEEVVGGELISADGLNKKHSIGHLLP
jgi:hypothetical protein